MNRTDSDRVWDALGARLIVVWPEVASEIARVVAEASNRRGGVAAVQAAANRVLASWVDDVRAMRHVSFEVKRIGGAYQLKTVARTVVGRAWVRLMDEAHGG